MKCANCPIFQSTNSENGKEECCGIFGDSWDNRFQYEDKDGNIVGCYIDRHYIEHVDKRICEYYERYAEYCDEMPEPNRILDDLLY